MQYPGMRPVCIVQYTIDDEESVLVLGRHGAVVQDRIRGPPYVHTEDVAHARDCLFECGIDDLILGILGECFLGEFGAIDGFAGEGLEEHETGEVGDEERLGRGIKSDEVGFFGRSGAGQCLGYFRFHLAEAECRRWDILLRHVGS